MVVMSTRNVASLVGFISFSFPFLLAFLCTKPSFTSVVGWAIAQWIPISFSIRNRFLESAWNHWEVSADTSAIRTEMPIVDVQKHRHHLLQHLDETYGKDWRRQPLLLRGMWTTGELHHEHRELSEKGLRNQPLVIPYFRDSRQEGALSPDAVAPIQDIVANITNNGAPHKIGSQLLVQTFPHLIKEVAPADVVKELFGDRFEPENVIGSGPFGLFPATTTVPVFVAAGREASSDSEFNEKKVFTALHCEPIGNVAVQLSGQKRWTLVLPEYAWQIQPTLAPDGRAFFVSWKAVQDIAVPTYQVDTKAGDAIWVPTWTWHRVDYIESDEIAIGASLFHFRVADFFQNNPVFAIFIIPALIKELLGVNTQ